ncbi:MAG TPA: NAD-glutamate dehydrogenase, partial [Colwellia sp.]|nr:NAD-glutamate dehydrogenase [Colwellia sp.]
LDRALEFIPDDEEISDRIAKGNGLTRPELAVLLAYSKMVLKEELVHEQITDNPYHNRLLVSAFPKQLRDKYQYEMQQHPLRAEIIATKLANKIGNDMGFNFVNRMEEETGATVVEIANFYTIACAVFELEEFWQKIEVLNNKISTAIQTEMLFQYRRTIRRATRWFLRHRNKAISIEQSIALYQPTFAVLSQKLNDFIIEGEAEEIQRVESDLITANVPKVISQRIARLSTIFSVLDIADIAEQQGKDIDIVAHLYFKLGVRLELHWFLDQITCQSVSNHWQALARASFREELDWQKRSLTVVVLQCDCNMKVENLDDMLDAWMEINEQPVTRWQHILSDFKVGQTHEFAMFSVALRELMLLSLNCEKVLK